MKKRLVLLVVLGLSSSSSALAEQGDWWLGIHLGGSVPEGDFRETARPGPEFGLVGTCSTTDRAEIGVEVDYHDWGPIDVSDPFLDLLFGPGTRLEPNALVVGVRVIRYSPPLGKASFYGTGGFGGTRFSGRLVAPQGHSYPASPRLGYHVNAGAGINFDITRGQRISIGGRYHIVQAMGGPVHFVSFGLNVMWCPWAK